jgi:pyruvate dehydrogenase E1 component
MNNRFNARSHIERLFAGLPPHCGIVSVLDGHPATLAWLGAVEGHRVRPLGVEHFGQSRWRDHQVSAILSCT